MPTVEMELFERSPHAEYVWERHLLRVRHGERSIGLAMGLRTGDEVHWWEACRLVIVEETPECLTVEMGGAIPHKLMSIETFHAHPGLTNPFLHKHNWLNGKLFARIHANGVCEIYAHHINSKFFDDGLALQDAVPVLGIATDASPHETAALCGAWDGSVGELEVGGARFDLREVARLATPQQPGRLDRDGDFLILQPYQGMELFGGTCPTQLIGDPFIFHAEQHIIPRGMARTLRFSLSLSDRSPRIARYLAPAWWYGACEEFLPAPLLPVANEYDAKIEAARRWILDGIVEFGFEDGAVPRGTGVLPVNEGGSTKRHEPGWEGEIPYAQFLAAWRSGEACDYDAAMRSAYHFTDVAVDHAAKLVRMHGYPPHAFAIPMNRVQGAIAAFLETGDAYLLETAKSVTANSHWAHLNSWPRLAVGRDACYVRSAVLLYRYFGYDYFREIAHEGALTVAQSQRPNGSFGDQGGGVGLHQWGGYITKPWMGLLSTNGVLDYLELFPNDVALVETVKKFADWLMAERLEIDGIRTWTYQHDFNGTREFYDPTRGVKTELPTAKRWHQENIGRLMFFCAACFDEPAYLEAWAESYTGKAGVTGDHSTSALLQFLPSVQAQLWRATLDEDGIHISPTHFGPRTPREARILAPEGEVAVRWTDDGTVGTPEFVRT